MSIELSVPKPIAGLEAISVANDGVLAAPSVESKRDVIGTSDSQAVDEACKRAQDAGVAIVTEFGAVLANRDRSKVLTAFRRTLFPARRPGRRPKEKITAAHRDWKNGMRGPSLYRAHIPGWEKHNRFRQQSEQRTLMEAIRTRVRREQEQTGTGDKAKMQNGISQSGEWSS